jgi:hypothetical protein
MSKPTWNNLAFSGQTQTIDENNNANKERFESKIYFNLVSYGLLIFSTF